MGVICDLLVRIIITYTCMEPLSHSGGGGWIPVPAESYRKKGTPSRIRAHKRNKL